MINKENELISVDAYSDDDREKDQNKTVGITTDHTGDIFISERVMNVRDFPLRQSNIRDLMPVNQTSSSQITGPEVYDYTDDVYGGFSMLAENASSPEIGFKTKENTWSVKRIAANLPLSKRYMKENGLSWIVNYLGRRLTRFIRAYEDFQLLFGDGW